MKRILLFTTLLCFYFWSLKAQVANYTFSQSTGSYASITGGTVSASGASIDDVIQSVTLPTAFPFNGNSITTVGFSPNGYLIMGNIITHGYIPISSTATSNGVIAALGMDLVSNVATSELRWQAVGNEIIFQWKEFRRYLSTPESVSFQIRLNTSTGAINIIYDGSTSVTTSIDRVPQVGLRGASSTDYFARRLTVDFPDTSPAWNDTGAATNNAHNVRFTTTIPAAIPTAGLTFTFTPPACATPTGLTVSSVTATGATLNWTAPSPAPSNGYQWEIRTSATPSGGTLAASGTTSAGVTTANAMGLSANTTYYLHVRSNCGGAGFSSWATSGAFFTGYCLATGTSGSTQITNVSMTGLTNLNNTSAGNAGYGNFTAVSPTVSQSAGSAVSFTLTYTSDPGTAIYIDWNSNLVFEAPERMFTSNGYFTGSRAGSFNVPPGQPSGNYRLRVVADWNSMNPIACPANINGETEDYTFTVAAPPACLAPTAPTATNITATSANVSWTAPASAPSGGYQWAVTTSITPPASGTAATGTSASATGLSSNTTYYLHVRSNCGGAGFSSWATSALFRTPPGCGDTWYDTGGPSGNYANNESYTTVICPTVPGEVVTINFTSIGLETCCDNLGIYNGTGTGSPLNIDLTAPASFTSTAGNGCITVTFTSDGSITGTGWVAGITCAAPPAVPNCATALTSPSNGATGVVRNPQLTWTAPTGGGTPTGYKVYLGTATNPALVTTVTGLTYTPSGQAYSTTYYWRIVPTNATGDAVGCTTEFSYMTEMPPPPPNNVCADAIELFCGDTDIAGTTSSANDNNPGNCNLAGDGNSGGVWYYFAGNNTEVTITVNADPGNPNDLDDSQVAVYSGSCGTLVCEAGNDDATPPGGNGSRVTFTADAGTDYYIYVDGFSLNSGDFEISVSCVLVNDVCADAIELFCGDTDIAGTTSGANDNNPGNCNLAGDGNSGGVWYYFAGNNAEVTITVNADPGNPNDLDDSQVAVYSGSCGTLVCEAGNDDATPPGGNGSRVTFTADAGTDYYIYVDGFSLNSGDFEISVSCVPICGADNVALITANGTYNLDQPCDDGNGWTYYSDPNQAGNYMFAIQWDPNNTGANVSAKANAAVSVNLQSMISATNGTISASYGMRRYWNVQLLNGASMNGLVNVKFFYSPAEKTATETAAANFAATNGVPNNGFSWFKTSGAVFTPADITASDFQSSVVLLTQDGSGTENGVTYVQFNGVSSFSGGTGASGAGAGFLPVELMAFRGNAMDAGNKLSWETATEQNAARFVIERSADGHTRWQDVGDVAAAGNTQTTQQYSFMDTKPLASAYYRLRMIDQDNTFDYSPIIQLQRHSKDAALTVFPVPAQNEVQVSFYLEQAGPVAVSIYDLTGKLVSQTTLNLTSGLQQERLEVSSLASGVYLLNVEAGGQRYVERLIKQ